LNSTSSGLPNLLSGIEFKKLCLTSWVKPFVNAIAPGAIETDMTKGLTQEVRQSFLNSIPLKRFGKPEEVANLAVFLASEESSYLTGSTIYIDGGLLAS
jgi:NAD(P)-dependent dehydrogenase (short-subunit alcohol dehydrogenase family)